MWRLFYPLKYFRLVNDAKRHIDFVPTILLAVVITSVYVLIPESVFFHPDGFLDRVTTLTIALTAFYVAALVAASTFNHPDLDKTIHAGSIVLISKDVDGKAIPDYLSRREFACMIFGYLAFSSLLFSIAGAIATSLVHVFVSSDFKLYLRAAGVLVFSVWISHIVVVTGLGLYYLMDRLYRRDRQITTKKPGANRAA